MSSYIVEDKVINSVVSFLGLDREGEYTRRTILTNTGCDLTTHEGKTQLGVAMFALNCNAVEQRYGAGEAKEFRDLNYSFLSEMPPTRMQAYKSLSSWLYQCAEGDVPDTSLLYATMKEIHADLAHSIVRTMPAYDKAGW